MKFKGNILVTIILVLFSVITARAEYEPFAVVSDSHIGLSDTIYQAIIEKIDEQGINTIIHAGDAIHTYGSAKQWRRFLDITGQNRHLRLAPGNHDIRSKLSYQTYLRFVPEPYHSFSDGDTLFILLNTSIPEEEHRVAGEQLKWLKSELQRSFRYKFVFLHEPLYPVVPFHGIDRNKAARDTLHRLFQENGVTLVVSGHDHYYKRMRKDDIEYIVMGASGGRLTVFEHNGDFFCYALVNRLSDGYSFVIKDLRGNVRDEFSVRLDQQNLPTENSGNVTVTTGSRPSRGSIVKAAFREMDLVALVNNMMLRLLRFFASSSTWPCRFG